MKQFLLPLIEVLEILAVVFISVYVIYGFIAQPFLVQGASMEPNFYSGDYLLVDEATYYFREPARGEVIVFKNPNNVDEFYIKRIVGLPGEQVVINDGEVIVDGEKVDESYLADASHIDGDNRPQSFDSRNWGPLGEDFIIGVVRLRFWPPASVDKFEYQSS